MAVLRTSLIVGFLVLACAGLYGVNRDRQVDDFLVALYRECRKSSPGANALIQKDLVKKGQVWSVVKSVCEPRFQFKDIRLGKDKLK